MKKQVVVIHGGDTFDSYDEYLSYLKSYQVDFERLKARNWKESLEQRLGKNYEVLNPRMPNAKNAKYLEWRIWFDKLATYFDREAVFVGHSLGGIFLAKYLAENRYPKKILGTFLVAAPFDLDRRQTLADFILSGKLDGFQNQGGKIYIFHSKDDPIVPIVDAMKYKKLLPKATLVTFRNKGHFFQDTFPELEKKIESLFKEK